MKYINKQKYLKNVKFVKDCSDGYNIYPKMKNFSFTSITIFDEDIICYYIEKNFLIKFKKLLEELSEDGSDDEKMLNKIESLEWIILNQYKPYLTLEKLKLMLKDLYFIKHKFTNNNIISSIKSR